MKNIYNAATCLSYCLLSKFSCALQTPEISRGNASARWALYHSHRNCGIRHTKYFISDFSFIMPSIVVPINKHNSKLSCSQAKCWKKRERCGSATSSWHHWQWRIHFYHVRRTELNHLTTQLEENSLAGEAVFDWLIFNTFMEFWADWNCQCYMPRSAHPIGIQRFVGSHETAFCRTDSPTYKYYMFSHYMIIYKS
jgi:hypothetical protein